MRFKALVVSVALFIFICYTSLAVDVSGSWGIMPKDAPDWVENNTWELELVQFEPNAIVGTYYIHNSSDKEIINQGPISGSIQGDNVGLYLTFEYQDPKAYSGKGWWFGILLGKFQEEQGIRRISGTEQRIWGNPATLRAASWGSPMPFTMWLVG